MKKKSLQFDFDQDNDDIDMTSRIFGDQTRQHLDDFNAQTEKKRQKRDTERQNRARKASLVDADDFFDERPSKIDDRHNSTQKSSNPFDNDDDDDDGDDNNQGVSSSNNNGSRSRAGSSIHVTIDPAVEAQGLGDDGLDDPLLAYYASFGLNDDGEGDDEDYCDEDYDEDLDRDQNIGQERDGKGDKDDKSDKNQGKNPFDDDQDLPLDLSKLEDSDDDDDVKDDNGKLSANAIMDEFDQNENDQLQDDNKPEKVEKIEQKTPKLSPKTPPKTSSSKLNVPLTATTTYGLPLEISYVLDHIDPISQNFEQKPSSSSYTPPPNIKNGVIQYDLAHHTVLPSEYIKHFVGALLGLDTSSIISSLPVFNTQNRQEVNPEPTVSLITLLSLFVEKTAVYNVLLKNILSSVLHPLMSGSYGEYIPANLKSIPSPPPPIDNINDISSKINKTAIDLNIDTQFICNHIPYELRNPSLLSLPLQQIIADFGVVYTLLPVLTTLEYSRLPPLLFTLPLSSQRASTGNTALATTTKYDIIDYCSTLQNCVGVEKNSASLKLSFKEKQVIKTQERFKKEWSRLTQSQEVLPRLGAWIGYCCTFIQLLNKFQIDFSTFLPSNVEVDLLIEKNTSQFEAQNNPINLQNISSHLQLRLDLLDILRFNLGDNSLINTTEQGSETRLQLSPQNYALISSHLRSHLLFLFFILKMCSISANALQWCTILMNFDTPTAYLFASLYIQHAPYDSKPVWVRY